MQNTRAKHSFVSSGSPTAHAKSSSLHACTMPPRLRHLQATAGVSSLRASALPPRALLSSSNRDGWAAGGRAPSGCRTGEHRLRGRRASIRRASTGRAGVGCVPGGRVSEHRRPHSRWASTGRATLCDDRAEGGSHALDEAASSRIH
jgi:hypothetical protein